MVARPALPPVASAAVSAATRLVSAGVRAGRLPVHVAQRLGVALPVPERVRRQYDDLAERGATVVARLRQPAGADGPAQAAVDAGAPGTATDLVERAEEQAHAAGVPTGATLDRDELPLPDFDHLTLGSVRGRLRRLSLAELVQLREYEVAHGNRLPIVTMLDNRIAKLTADQERAQPS